MPKRGEHREITSDAYAVQMRRGFFSLVFAPAIEREYQAWNQKHEVVPALVCAGLALIIWTGFAIYDLFRVDFFSRQTPLPADLWALLAVRWSVGLALVLVLVNAGWLRQHLQAAAMFIYLAIGAGAAVTSHVFQANGLPSAELTQLIVVMAAFLPIGLTFYQSLAAALVVICMTMVSAVLILAPEAEIEVIHLVLAMSLALPVGAIGGYLRDYARREQFLLRQLLGHQAQFDHLTDLANRRMLERRAQKAIAHARRQREPVVFAMIDVDYFKAYNDLYGHAAGDRALVQVAQVLRENTRRPMDLAARMGGEEFAILLYESDIARARPMLMRLAAEIAALNIAHAASPVADILTVSMGVVLFDGTEDIDSLYARADALLYEAKQAGRNRCVFQPERTRAVSSAS